MNSIRPETPNPQAANVRLVIVEAEGTNAAIRRLVAGVVRPIARLANPLPLRGRKAGANGDHGLRCAPPVATGRGPVGAEEQGEGEDPLRLEDSPPPPLSGGGSVGAVADGPGAGGAR